MIEISVVIPVYGCRACLEELHRRLVSALAAITQSYEIILVNDACPQNSWEVIKQIALKDPRVKGLDLSRNFGQIRAITAGLHYAEGDWVVVMDCDLQDQPEEIIRLYNKAQEGYDVVFARRAVRKDTVLKKLSSHVFYAIYSYFTAGAFDSTICNFSISRRMVMDGYKRMGDQTRAFTLFIKWMGFKSTAIDINHDERGSGKSSYTLKKQLHLALEIITTQSNKPLILSLFYQPEQPPGVAEERAPASPAAGPLAARTAPARRGRRPGIGPALGFCASRLLGCRGGLLAVATTHPGRTPAHPAIPSPG